MPKLYIQVPISERMPVVGRNTPSRLQKVVLIDNCGVKHIYRTEDIVDIQLHLLDIGYTHWLEEVEVSEDVLELVKGGGDHE